MALRVLVVDDTILFRSVVTEALRTLPGVDVVGSAASGRGALVRIKDLNPDLVTLDIEMPGMDGFQVLDEMRKIGSDAGVIIVSSHTVSGSVHTVKALEKGAFDFITKPSFDSVEKNRIAVVAALAPRVKAFERRREITTILRGAPQARKSISASGADVTRSDLDSIARKMQRIAGTTKPEIVLVGVSTGGPEALAQLLPAIPANIGVPVVIVQHMPPMFTKALAESLNGKCALTVREAVHGEIMKPDTVYIAPGGRQIRFEATASASLPVIAITDDPPENNCKPSVDYLFRSAAHSMPGRSMAVILTGMGNDGTMGLRLLKRHGCFVLAQDEATCIVYGMPKTAVDAGVVDEVLPLGRIAPRIVDIVSKGTP